MSGNSKFSKASVWSTLAETIVQLPQPPAPLFLGLAGGATILTGSALLSAFVLDQDLSWLAALKTQRSLCQTLATDPNPPLNVRSSPIVAPDNVIGKVANGTVLQVVDRQQGWLRVSQPLEGWVYEELTVTSCTPKANGQPPPFAPEDLSERAIALYHEGNLSGAIALAKTIPSTDARHAQTQAAIAQWQRDWQRAESAFYTAQRAARQGKWQEVLDQIPTFPDNRYWREKIAPLVREASHQLANRPTP